MFYKGFFIQVMLVLIVVSSIKCQQTRKELMRVFSDFNNPQDRQFFRTTLPYIVDNIGSNVRIVYYFRDNGRNSGPRMCALDAMRRNAYLQADYLRCEAEGNTSNMCRRLLPINNATYNRCLRDRVDRYTRRAQREFSTLRTNRTPAIVLDGSWRLDRFTEERLEYDDMEPSRLLNNICWGWGAARPSGCINPLPPPAWTTMAPRNNLV